MLRSLIVPILLAIIAAASYSAYKYGVEDEPNVPENDAEVRARLERQREAGVR